MTTKDYQDPTTLRELYVEQDLSQDQIAERFGVSSSTISNWIRTHGIEKDDPPWRDEELLRQLYWDEELSIHEITDRLNTYADVVHRWMGRLDIPRRPDPHSDRPWHDEDLLREMYFEEGMSQQDIADHFGTTQSVICDWFRRHEIETPTYAEAGQLARRVNRTAFRTTKDGYEISESRVGEETHRARIHRLVVVAEYGFDTVTGNVVHHRNEIPWDNRPRNLVPMSDSEHKQYHAQRRGEQPPEGF